MTHKFKILEFSEKLSRMSVRAYGSMKRKKKKRNKAVHLLMQKLKWY